MPSALLTTSDQINWQYGNRIYLTIYLYKSLSLSLGCRNANYTTGKWSTGDYHNYSYIGKTNGLGNDCQKGEGEEKRREAKRREGPRRKKKREGNDCRNGPVKD